MQWQNCITTLVPNQSTRSLMPSKSTCSSLTSQAGQLNEHRRRSDQTSQTNHLKQPPPNNNQPKTLSRFIQATKTLNGILFPNAFQLPTHSPPLPHRPPPLLWPPGCRAPRGLRLPRAAVTGPGASGRPARSRLRCRGPGRGESEIGGGRRGEEMGDGSGEFLNALMDFLEWVTESGRWWGNCEESRQEMLQ